MKVILFLTVLAINASAFGQSNPFSKFEGKYTSQDCKCIGTGKDQFSYEPCNIESIAIRSYQTSTAQTAWVMDEVLITKYIVRPLDEIAIKPMLAPGETVSTNLHGDANQAVVTFTFSKGGISNYEIRKSLNGFQYVGGYKGISESGVPIDLQCYHTLTKN